MSAVIEMNLDVASYLGRESPESALADVLLEPTPCRGCGFESFCAGHKTACHVFDDYVAKGKFIHNQPRLPSASVYRRLFSE